MSGLRSDSQTFGLYCLSSFLLILGSQSLGYLASSLSSKPNLCLAICKSYQRPKPQLQMPFWSSSYINSSGVVDFISMTVPVLGMPTCLFSNVVYQPGSLAPYLAWMEKLSILYYAISTQILGQYR